MMSTILFEGRALGADRLKYLALYTRTLALLLILFCHPVAFGFSSQTGNLLLASEDAQIKSLPDKAREIRLIKNVQVVFQGQHLSCDEALINTSTKTLDARGKVIFTTPTTLVEADRIVLNYDTSTGSIFNGFVQMGQVQFQGEQIERTGKETYEAVHGTYTACATCPPAWSFSGSKVKAENGGYTAITNPILRAGGVPILWLPYIMVPLKSERQSGLLFPTFGISAGSGQMISQSFFWAMSPHQDSTWTLKNYSYRGLKGLLEYRYMATATSRGDLFASYIKDKKEGLKRWQTQYRHRYDLPDDYVHRLSLNLISDVKYPLDFYDEIRGRGDPALENRMSLFRNYETQHSSLDVDYYVNLLKTGPKTDNLEAVHRFPELRYSIVPQKSFLGRALLSMDVNYSNFVRGNFTYDDRTATGAVPLDGNQNPLPDGTFDGATDIVRTGQRISLKPKIAYPIQAGESLDLLPSLSLEETHYQFPLAGSANTSSTNSIGYLRSAERRYLRSELLARTRVSRIYYEKDPDDLYRIKHEIEPEVIYSTLPWQYTSNHPFFGPSTAEPFFKPDSPITDSDVIQFDYFDRLYQKNLVTFSLTNRLIRKRLDPGSTTDEYKQFATFRLSQSYDFYELERRTNEPRQPWSDVSGLLDIRLDNFETNSLVRHFVYQNEASVYSRAKIFANSGEFFELNYSKDFVIERGTREITNRNEYLITTLGFGLRHIDFTGSTEYSILDRRTNAYSYAMNIRPPGNCWGFYFRHRVPVGADPDFSINFFFLFDGKTATSVNTTQVTRTMSL